MMKHIFLLSGLLFFIATPLFAQHGALLITKSAYFYKEPTQSSKKILTKRHKAYNIIGIKEVGEDIFFKISVPSKNNKVNGSGFILENDRELEEKTDQKIKVYGEIPTTKINLTNFLLIQTNEIKLTGKATRSSHFLGIKFREVNYTSLLPREYWVLDWAGVFRADQSATWLNEAYKDIKQLKIKKTKRDKLLLGIIETGYSMKEVALSWGEATREQKAKEAGEIEWIYPNRKVIFLNGLVKQQL